MPSSQGRSSGCGPRGQPKLGKCLDLCMILMAGHFGVVFGALDFEQLGVLNQDHYHSLRVNVCVKRARKTI